ncbi:MFS transporter [Amorphus orientalis]|uniref:MFS family permease n=1 Tax=Amorphus orientalis TaxID=649198 RepID=A0AAE3VR67_9HYPH|nr:MFS transporter [Amorphus orientalis]MDQ0316819.1 MFS family permease [Amorphus orientalis]
MTIGPLLIRTLVPADAEAQPCPPARKPWVIATAALAAATALIDLPVVTMALGGLRAEFGASFAMAQWLLLLAGLATAALILPSRRLGTLHGHWHVLGAGLLVSALGGCIAGLSPRLDLLFFGRLTQGVAAAVVLPASAALIAVNFAPGERPGAFRTWTLTSGIGAVLATLAAGAAILAFGWRAAFLLPAALSLATWALLRLRVPIDFPDLVQKPLDLAGAAILFASGGLILVAITLAGIGFGLPVVAMLAGSGLVGLCLFGFWETGPAAEPMLALSRLRSPGFGLATGAAALAEIGAAGTVFLLPIALMEGSGRSALAAALGLGCYLAGQGASGVLAGRLQRRMAPPLAAALGSGLGAAALVLLALSVLADLFWLGVLPATLLLGLTAGAASTILLAEARRHGRASTTGDMQTVAIRFAILIAIAASGTIAALAYRDLIGTLAPALSASPAGADFAAPSAEAAGFLSQRMTGVRLAFVRAATVGAFVTGIAGLGALVLSRAGPAPPAPAAPKRNRHGPRTRRPAPWQERPASPAPEATPAKPKRGARRVEPPSSEPSRRVGAEKPRSEEPPPVPPRRGARRIAPPKLHQPSGPRPPRR